MTLRELLDMYDNWNDNTVVNDENLAVIVRGRTCDLLTENPDLENAEVEAFGFFDGEFAVRIKRQKQAIYTPKIKLYRIWHAEDVRQFCMKNNYYTNGNNEEYTAMLNFVENNDPTPENIYEVARNILNHSSSLGYEFYRDDSTSEDILHVMYYLEKEVVWEHFDFYV